MASKGFERAVTADFGATLREAGASGAGGAGFPSYVKWEELEDIDHLLINHQESEPNFYADKYLLREYAEEFAAFFDMLLGEHLESVVVGAKAKDRGTWMREFETVANATVCLPGDLPLDVEGETGVVMAYTDDRFQYGMESALLPVTAGVTIGNDLPGDYGWIVHNTETAYNVSRAVQDGEPVTTKLVHVDGNVPRHRCLEVPIGTPATTLLEAAGTGADELGDDHILLDGGPGWAFAVDEDVEEFGVSKRTNGVLVCDEGTVEEHTHDGGRVDIRPADEWADGSHETDPVEVVPDSVRLPLLTNPDYEGVIEPSVPTVEPGDRVSRGDVVADACPDGISTPQHASIDGTVTDVTDRYVELQAR